MVFILKFIKSYECGAIFLKSSSVFEILDRKGWRVSGDSGIFKA